MLIVLIFGTQNKGAKRWIYVFEFSLQPSEIIKPFFIIVTSFIVTEFKKEKHLHLKILLSLYSILALLLILQPDLGMLILITIIFFIELFLTMINLKFFLLLGMVGIIVCFLLYFIFPHFSSRIDTFINSVFFDGEKGYQVKKSISAFSGGGLLGKGPLEGSIKNLIPDAHTDFIFSVIGEEFGGIICILIISLFFYISVRMILKTVNMKDNFKYIAISILSLQFLLQSIINIAVTLNLLPAKGMTLPFISYGGSSMIGTSIGIGFLLALSKKTYGNDLNETSEFSALIKNINIVVKLKEKIKKLEIRQQRLWKKIK
jgi:cell division protein FtsW